MPHLPQKILIATKNLGKVNEIRDLIQDLPIEFLSLAEFPDAPDVVEDGETFEENALKKARTLALATGLVTLADDSGLCVEALNGRPGVLSARYSGEGSSDEEKCLRILEEMSEIPDSERYARFVCVLALADPGGEEYVFRGVCEGRIIRELKGTKGFGYDPIFLYEEEGLTFAEMDRQSKNLVSHRGLALRKFGVFLEQRARP
ncbi:MAG: XTP/dITP diphosphatase [Desulfomonile tiedjei]|uniref:dITP/XTP pyrophosphatase n=1 Tax=Desulfomonile tiedjei TaxID=2358 RepID=A0A9D6V2I9_9BACT|nr:XTP/dITP diphosphatase [Desulfomonile tiedjei]